MDAQDRVRNLSSQKRRKHRFLAEDQAVGCGTKRSTAVSRIISDGVLLVDWLNALIYEMAARRMLFGRFRVTLEGERLLGIAWRKIFFGSTGKSARGDD